MEQITTNIEKVSELEWYLTMQAYHNTYHQGKGAASPLAKNMTMEEFREFYEGIKNPIAWTESKTVGFFSPFNDVLTIYPGASMEIPLGFQIEGEYAWIQPVPDTLLFSSKRIEGESNAKGTVLVVTNISTKPFTLNLIANKPLCALNIRAKPKAEEQNKEPDEFSKLFEKLNQTFVAGPEHIRKDFYEVPVLTECDGKVVEEVVKISIPTLERLVSVLEQLGKE